MALDTTDTPTAADELVALRAPSERTRIKRMAKRAHYDRATIHGIVDAALVCHAGYVIDGQPYVTPTMHWRQGDDLYWHGSSASRMLRAQSTGIPVCLTVSLIDGVVFARSGFNHSANYRCVMALGDAEKVEDPDEKLASLIAFSERLAPGRWTELRPPTGQELKATTVLRMPLNEASAKVRQGPPGDDEEDYALPVWAGVLPLVTVAGEPVPCPRLAPGTPVPAHLQALRDAKG